MSLKYSSLALSALLLLDACSEDTAVVADRSVLRDLSGDESAAHADSSRDRAIRDASTASDQSKKTSLVGCWKMDETSGKTLVEAIAGRNATRNTTTGQVGGKVGNSQRFTYVVNSASNAYTSSEYATVPHHVAFNFAADSSFTISYWVKPRDCGYGFQDHIAISKGEWSGGGSLADGMWASGFNGSCKINFLLRDNTGYKIDLEGTTQYSTETWHHVVGVRDEASGKNLLYVDGAIADQATYDYTGTFSNSMDLQLGNLINSGAHNYLLKGDLDEVAIFNRALSSSEINQIRSDAASNKSVCAGSL
jgi:hypothetical protein